MRLYHASMSLRIVKRYWSLFQEPLNVLLSYAYIGSDTYTLLVSCRHMIDSIIADSGAWSVAKRNALLTIQGLISYLVLHGHRFYWYFNFDTDFSDKGFDNNIANQLKMERAGLHPVPVVHNLFDREIDYYVDSGKYDRIALGSSQTTNFDDIAYAVNRIKKKNEAIKIHWFGGSKFDWLVQLPISACDTSSWGSMGKFGHIAYWNPLLTGLNKAHVIYTGGMIKEFKENEFDYVSYPWRKELDDYILNTFGLTYRDLCGYDSAFNMQLINTRFFTEQERRINEERSRRGIPLE